MSRLTAPLRALLLSTLAHPLYALPAMDIFGRQSTCAASGLTSCPGSLPLNFCCESNHDCLPLAGNTSAMCCPKGSKCTKIQPIICDLRLQDPQVDPTAAIKTNAFGAKLPKCGDGCCPFGFNCNADGECIMDEDQSQPPAGASSSPTTTTTSGSTTTPSSTSKPTESLNASPTNNAEPQAQGNEKKDSSPMTTVVVGVILGVLGGVAVTVFVLMWLARRRRKANGGKGGKDGKPRITSSTSSAIGNKISDPIVNEDATIRTDFILKTPTTVHTVSPVRSSPSRNSHVGSIFRQDPITRPPAPGTVPVSAVPPIRGMNQRPQTPRLQREPSSESINIWAAPGTVERDRRMTTFTDLMEEADLTAVARGQPFVPSYNSSPASRR